MQDSIKKAIEKKFEVKNPVLQELDSDYDSSGEEIARYSFVKDDILQSISYGFIAFSYEA